MPFKSVSVFSIHLNRSRFNSLKTSVINYLKQSSISQGQEEFTVKEIPEPKEVHVIAVVVNGTDPRSTMEPLSTATEEEDLLCTGSCF